MHADAERDYVLGMKYQEIADKYGVSVNTVKSWKRRYNWKRVTTNGAPKREKKVQMKKGCKQVQYAPVILLQDDNILTDKQKLFCQFFANNRNATQAAIKAGYSKNTATEIGYENLTKPHIRAEVDRIKKLMSQAIMLSPDDIVERYMRIAFADMTDVAEWGTEEVVDIDKSGNIQIDQNGNVKKIKRIYFNVKDHDQVDGGLISEIKMGSQGLSVKLESRQKALEWLSNYFDMNPMNKHKRQYDNAVLALREKEFNLKNF